MNKYELDANSVYLNSIVDKNYYKINLKGSDEMPIFVNEPIFYPWKLKVNGKYVDFKKFAGNGYGLLLWLSPQNGIEYELYY